jgi:hypothetical protein
VLTISRVTAVLSEDALAFERDGFVRVSAVVERDACAAMRESLRTTLAAHRVGGERLVDVAGALRPGPGTETVLWEAGRQAAFASLPDALRRAADGVFGADVWSPADERGGLAAPNYPIPGVWSVPHQAWHVDEPTTAGCARSWGLLGFVFLDEVEPGGGATVMLAGSQRRLLALASASPGGLITTDEALAALSASDSWFADLLQPGDPAERRRRYIEDGHVSAGVPLRVVELTGAEGDVVLMDPRCLHTVSANVSHRARLTMRMVCARQI